MTVRVPDLAFYSFTPYPRGARRRREGVAWPSSGPGRPGSVTEAVVLDVSRVRHAPCALVTGAVTQPSTASFEGRSDLSPGCSHDVASVVSTGQPSSCRK